MSAPQMPDLPPEVIAGIQRAAMRGLPTLAGDDPRRRRVRAAGPVAG